MNDRELAGLYPFLSEGGGAVDVLDDLVRSTREKADELLRLYELAEAQFEEDLTRAAIAIAARFHRGGRLYTFGNGGSATDAADMAGAAGCFSAVSLAADTAVITALANDVGFEVVFARPLAAFGRSDDIACGLSTSGNSRNVIAAFEAARARGMLTVGFAGYEGGDMASCGLIDHLFVVSSSSVHRIQETQTALYHLLIEEAREIAARAPTHARSEP
jgi:D-sedoheptulose 7-phosphate isomerase